MKLYLLWYDDYDLSQQLKGVYSSIELAQQALINEAPNHVHSWSKLTPQEQIKTWMYLSFSLEEVELNAPYGAESEYIKLNIDNLLSKVVGKLT